MACIITRPDPQVLFDHYKNMFSADVLGGSPVVPESNEWYVTALNYAMAEEFYALSEQAWKERDPRYACCDNLVDMAAQDGVYPKPAGFATGYMILSGTSGSVLPSRIEVIANGKNYATVGSVPSALPSNGTLVLRIQALQPGTEYNADGSVTTGQLTTAITGVTRTVQICGGRFCGGSAAETCEEFRQRYIARQKYAPRQNLAWVKERLLDWPCATRVCERTGSCCTCNEAGCQTCGSELKLYVMFDGTFPCGIAPENITVEINTWMFGARAGYGEGLVDIGVCGEIVQAHPLLVDLSIDIDACISAAQQAQIQEDIEDFFTTVCPSQPILAQQIEQIVYNVIGATIAVAASWDVVAGYENFASVSLCNDLEPDCDYMPCLRELRFTGPTDGTVGAC